jgi:hypothetical protein
MTKQAFSGVLRVRHFPKVLYERAVRLIFPSEMPFLKKALSCTRRTTQEGDGKK